MLNRTFFRTRPFAFAAQFAAAAGCVALATTPVQAQPTTLNKTAKLVVGFTPGGSADLVARTLAQNMAGYAPALIVDNKLGAGGRIALETVKLGETDGSNLAVTPASMVVLYPHIYKKLSYDPQADFTPVAMVASFSFVLIVGQMVPASVTNVSESLQWCKANPKKAAYASPGAGSIPHFVGSALDRASGVSLTHVAYKGGALAMTDVIGGQIAANIAVISNALPMLQAGKIRALAVTGKARTAQLPNVPTLAESGFKELVASEWFGVFARSKTPPDVVAKLNGAVLQAMQTTAMRDVLAKASFELAAANTPAEFATMMKADRERWAAIVKNAGFTPED